MQSTRWPDDPHAAVVLQRHLANLEPPSLTVATITRTGGCFVCFERGQGGAGAAGDLGWAAATAIGAGRGRACFTGRAGAPYRAGLLAMREGPLLAGAVEALPVAPDVLLVNATGRDHPRRAGLALQLGWALGLPTVGVTHRPLLATGDEPGPEKGARAPLSIGGEQVGWWLRTRTGARPLAVSPGWRMDLDSAAVVVERAVADARSPEPIREARRLARDSRAVAGGLGGAPE